MNFMDFIEDWRNFPERYWNFRWTSKDTPSFSLTESQLITIKARRFFRFYKDLLPIFHFKTFLNSWTTQYRVSACKICISALIPCKTEIMIPHTILLGREEKNMKTSNFTSQQVTQDDYTTIMAREKTWKPN